MKTTAEATDEHEHDLNVLAAFVDDRLDAAERASVAAHVVACRECRAVLAELARGRTTAPARGGWLARLPRSTVLPIAAALVVSAATSLMLLQRPGVRPESDTSPHQSPASAADPTERLSPGPSTVNPPPPVRSPGASRAATPPADERLLARRGGSARSVAGKSFRLVAGEWVDSAYDPLAGLPVVEASGPGREALLARLPGLSPYAALGERVLVVYEGTVYRLGPLAVP